MRFQIDNSFYLFLFWFRRIFFCSLFSLYFFGIALIRFLFSVFVFSIFNFAVRSTELLVEATVLTRFSTAYVNRLFLNNFRFECFSFCSSISSKCVFFFRARCRWRKTVVEENQRKRTNDDENVVFLFCVYFSFDDRKWFKLQTFCFDSRLIAFGSPFRFDMRLKKNQRKESIIQQTLCHGWCDHLTLMSFYYFVEFEFPTDVVCQQWCRQIENLLLFMSFRVVDFSVWRRRQRRTHETTPYRFNKMTITMDNIEFESCKSMFNSVLVCARWRRAFVIEITVSNRPFPVFIVCFRCLFFVHSNSFFF